MNQLDPRKGSRYYIYNDIHALHGICYTKQYSVMNERYLNLKIGHF